MFQVSGDLFIGLGPRLAVLNVHDPAQPKLVGRSELLTHPPQDVVIASSYVYVALGPGGLAVFDVSDAAKPIQIALVDSVEAGDIELAGTRLLVCDREWVRIFDVTDPRKPRKLGEYAPPGWCHGIAVAGNRAYVAVNGRGMTILDISSPEKPRELGHYGEASHARQVALAGNHAFVLETWGIFHTVDVSDVAHPRRIETEASRASRPSMVGPMVVRGTNVYMSPSSTADSPGLYIVDSANLPELKPVAYFHDGWPSFTESLAVEGTRVFALADGTLSIYDAAQPTNIKKVGAFEFAGPRAIAAMAAADDRLLVLGDNGLRVLEMPTAKEATFLALGGTGENGGICVRGKTAYVAAYAIGLATVDLEKLAVASTQSAFTTAACIDADESRIYVGGNDRVTIFKLEAGKAVESGSFFTEQQPVKDLACWEERLLLLTSQALVVVDVSDPSSPQEKLRLDCAAMGVKGRGEFYPQCNAFELAGHVVFLAAGVDGLKAIDFASPEVPKVIAGVDAVEGASSILVRDGRAYLADGRVGLRVFDVNDPVQPKEVGRLPLPGLAQHLALAGDLLHVGCFDAGVLTIRIEK